MSLQDLFTSFAKGSEMDGRAFAKLAKDCKILSKTCTTTDIDIIFAKSKVKSQRKLNFDQFSKAFEACAGKNKVSVEELTGKVLAAGGPKFTGTKADKVSLFDDKSNYTGVHLAGGPSTVDKGAEGLAGLLDRSEADVRGIKVNSEATITSKVANMKIAPTVTSSVAQPQPAKASKPAPACSGGGGGGGGLQGLFASFAKGSEMDGRAFAKLAKDCKILSKTCTTTDIDIIFAKSKVKSQRKLNFDQFSKAFEACAGKNKVSVEELTGKVLAAGGPKFTGTKADKVSLFDDKSNYTGVHVAGGPSTVDKGAEGLAGLLDRSDADVRGIKKQ